MNHQLVILGAGATGLAAGIASHAPIFEASSIPGGICASYYLKRNSNRRSIERSIDQDDYRFELGGGHWIFGGDDSVLKFLSKYQPFVSYQRLSAVYFRQQSLFVPYPLQNNLEYLSVELKHQIANERQQQQAGIKEVKTIKQWLGASFGETLCDLFFFPFHRKYTAGLWESISPQDGYKTPQIHQDKDLQEKGYNAHFVYPKHGLGNLFQQLASDCDIRFNHRVVKIDTEKKEIFFQNGAQCSYERIVSTIPLKQMIEICDIQLSSPPDPHTSVLVLNVGAKKGRLSPDQHWLYIPESSSGFHRVGFYSNVDEEFLPLPVRGKQTHISAYIEKAYPGGMIPSDSEVLDFSNSTTKELQTWGLLDNVEAIDPTWIDYAYTWQYPDSYWRTEALQQLELRGIYQAGRYGRWRFQGISASIHEGLEIGSRFAEC